jgi:hypothetical protein
VSYVKSFSTYNPAIQLSITLVTSCYHLHPMHGHQQTIQSQLVQTQAESDLATGDCHCTLEMPL